MGFWKDLWAKITGQAQPKPTTQRRRPRPRPKPVPEPEPEPILPALKTRIPYGDDPLQFIDVDLPERLASAPIICEAFDHGGGWRRGDAESSVGSKATNAHAHGRGFIAISYRVGVDSDPVVPVWTQAQDLAAAYATIRANASNLAIKPDVIRTGHSAGAHLLELVCSHWELARIAGNYLGSAALDSAAYDVEKTMKLLPRLSPEMQKLYGDAFGKAPNSGLDYQRQCSPMFQLSGVSPPKLLVFSEDRGPGDEATCRAYGAKAETFGTSVDIVPTPMKHGEINQQLGEDNDLTRIYNAWCDELAAGTA